MNKIYKILKYIKPIEPITNLIIGTYETIRDMIKGVKNGKKK